MDRASSDAEFHEALNEAFSSFRCTKDPDIEFFLQKKAVDFFRRGSCSVYILFDAELFKQGVLRVEAYFTLSHKSLVAAPEAVKSRRKKYGGSETAKTFNFVLIGQLGKHISADYISPLNGEYILDKAFEVIRQASELIPCKHALVECSDDPNVQKIYKDYEFTFFQNDGSHNQYTKKI